MAEYIQRETLLERAEYDNNYRLIIPAEAIKAVPAADVVPVVHGRWEQDANGDWYCTNCGEVVAIYDSGRERTYLKPYCPNCGAKMDGGADND